MQIDTISQQVASRSARTIKTRYIIYASTKCIDSRSVCSESNCSQLLQIFSAIQRQTSCDIVNGH